MIHRHNVVDVPLPHVFPRHANLELTLNVRSEFGIGAAERGLVAVGRLVSVFQSPTDLPRHAVAKRSPVPLQTNRLCFPKFRKLPFVSLHRASFFVDEVSSIGKTGFLGGFHGTFRIVKTSTDRTLPRKPSDLEQLFGHDKNPHIQGLHSSA
jgi:hypothetical protein